MPGNIGPHSAQQNVQTGDFSAPADLLTGDLLLPPVISATVLITLIVRDVVCHITTMKLCLPTLHLLRASFFRMHYVSYCRCGRATFTTHPAFTIPPQSSHSQQRTAPRAALMASITASAVQGLQQRRAANALLEPFSPQAANSWRAQWLPAPVAWVAGAVAQTLQQRQSGAQTEQAALQRRAGEACSWLIRGACLMRAGGRCCGTDAAAAAGSWCHAGRQAARRAQSLSQKKRCQCECLRLYASIAFVQAQLRGGQCASR